MQLYYLGSSIYGMSGLPEPTDQGRFKYWGDRQEGLVDPEFELTRLAASIYLHDNMDGFTGPVLFRFRLQFTGRLSEWSERINIMRLSHPDKDVSNVKTKVSREMGYKSKRDEMKHLAVFKAEVVEQEKVLRLRENSRRRWRKRKMDAFEAALRTLQASAPADEIMDWIAAHPAMSRHYRMGEEAIILEANDILDPPHGEAPCKAAAMQLQAFVNRPDKFFDKLLDRQIRAKSATSETLTASGEVGNIEKMLAALRGGDKEK